MHRHRNATDRKRQGGKTGVEAPQKKGEHVKNLEGQRIAAKAVQLELAFHYPYGACVRGVRRGIIRPGRGARTTGERDHTHSNTTNKIATQTTQPPRV